MVVILGNHVHALSLADERKAGSFGKLYRSNGGAGTFVTKLRMNDESFGRKSLKNISSLRFCWSGSLEDSIVTQPDSATPRSFHYYLLASASECFLFFQIHSRISLLSATSEHTSPHCVGVARQTERDVSSIRQLTSQRLRQPHSRRRSRRHDPDPLRILFHILVCLGFDCCCM